MNTLLIAVVTPLTLVLLVVGFGVLSRRLLGVRMGWFRVILAGLLTSGLIGPISKAVQPEPQAGSVTPLWFILLALACGLLIVMVLLVVAEAVVPTGSLLPPTQWLGSLRRRWGRTRRYSRIMTIAIRHGLGPYLSGRRRSGLADPHDRVRLARALARALEDSGVTFVKLGQVLSTRRDLLPVEFVTELSRLQDQVAPVGWDRIGTVLTDELGRSPDEVFASLEREPLAAASIAQVYAATLRSGERVVVKVQRPDIEQAVLLDLDIVARLAATLQANTRWGRSLDVVGLAHGFADAVREELDFRVEATNMAAVAAAATARADTSVRLPLPHTALCGRRVLVMQRLDGVLLDAGEDGPTPESRQTLARTLLHGMLRQVMLDGVFHADPHPGNVLVLADGGLGMLDFGSVGRLDAGIRSALQRLLLALDGGQPLAVTDALLEIVTRPDEIDELRLERDLGQFLARHLGPGATPGVRMFTDLFTIVTRHGLAIPPEVAAVFRALATLEGTLTSLAPGFDLVAEAREFGRSYLTEQLSTVSVRDLAVGELAALLPMLRRLPRRVDRIADALERGRLGVNVRLLSTDRERRQVTDLLHQALLAFFAPAVAVVAVLLLGTEGGPAVTGTVSLYQLFGYSLLVVSAVLALRVLMTIFRRDRMSDA
ncbi:MAG: AarF/UbiB family protein [Actinocatenispora sp.]